MGTHVARQPIFTDMSKLFGYELYYRDRPESQKYDGEDDDTASSETIANCFHKIGIEKITGGRRAFINFTEKLIVSQVPTLLPSDILVVEVPGTALPTPELLEACAELRGKGYLIALDRYAGEPQRAPFLHTADIVKIDFSLELAPNIRQAISSLKKGPVVMLADKVESYEGFYRAREMGIKLFQGNYFSKPSIIESNEADLSPLKSNCVRLINQVFQERLDFEAVSRTIMKDVSLSYRLLRVINSAFFGMRYTVSNVKQALAILGEIEVKKWVMLVSLAELSDGQPEELIHASLTRARFMELIAPFAGMSADSDDLFMLGLMSYMPAIMRISIEEVVRRTAMSPSISEPLIEGTGRLMPLFKLVTTYERGEWNEALALAYSLDIFQDGLSECYQEAMSWSNYIN